MSEWAPVVIAAPALGLSPRTLKRRVAKGAVVSKLENGRRLVAVPVGTLGPQNGTVPEGQLGQKGETTRKNKREHGLIDTGTLGHLALCQVGTDGPSVEPNATALLIEQRERDRAEISFLRGLVEQHQRSEAELRASLREALKAMPKQLTSGTEQIAPERPISSANGVSDPIHTPTRTPSPELLKTEPGNGEDQTLQNGPESEVDLRELDDLIYRVFGNK